MVWKNFNILLAGVGGQGIIFAGQIIMESALRQKKKVYGFEMHGMARRGGAVATHIRIGEELYSPLVPVRSGNLLAAFEPSEALRHMHFMNPEAMVILNTNPVIPIGISSQKGSYPDIDIIIDAIKKRCENVHSFDATQLAKEAKNPIAMNIVMLGAICASDTTLLPKEDVREIIGQKSPSYFRKINLFAFDLGYEELNKNK